MPPKAALPSTFSLDEVAVLLAFIAEKPSIPSKAYAAMSALDGNRTESSYQHTFRAVLARARELRADLDAGRDFSPVEVQQKRKKRKHDFLFPAPSLLS